MIIKFLATYLKTRKQWDTAGSARPEVQDAADSSKSIVKNTDNKGEKDNQHTGDVHIFKKNVFLRESWKWLGLHRSMWTHFSQL